MSANVPEPPAGAAGDAITGARRRSPRWWWGVAAIVALLAGVLLIRVWGNGGGSALPSVADSEASLLTPGLSPVAGAPLFDVADLDSLFVTAATLEEAVPAAADGVEEVRTGQPGQGGAGGGLAEGESVAPASCTAAAAVVEAPPVAHDERSWGNARLVFTQEVALLESVAAAEQAFRTLVTVVDACPEYVLLGPSGETTVVAAPAIEDQGFFPSLAQAVDVAAPGAEPQAQFRGHLLVGNVIVTWTASVDAGDDPAGERQQLGTEAGLDAMMQEQVRAAASALP